MGLLSQMLCNKKSPLCIWPALLDMWSKKMFSLWAEDTEHERKVKKQSWCAIYLNLPKIGWGREKPQQKEDANITRHANEKKVIYQRNLQKWMPASGRGGIIHSKDPQPQPWKQRGSLKSWKSENTNSGFSQQDELRKPFCAFYLLLVFYFNHRIARGTLMSTAVEEK